MFVFVAGILWVLSGTSRLTHRRVSPTSPASEKRAGTTETDFPTKGKKQVCQCDPGLPIEAFMQEIDLDAEGYLISARQASERAS